MGSLLLWIARFSGIGGVLLALAAMLVRVSGKYVAAGFQVGTLFQAGIAAMVLGCLAYLALLVEQRRP